MGGKYLNRTQAEKRQLPAFLIPVSFFFIEIFGFFFLSLEGENADLTRFWPLAFGLLWSGILSGFLRLFPWTWGRILYGVSYFFYAVYAGFQTGYYILFSQMMWLSDFRYASEGADYADVLLTYPMGWWLGIIAMIALGILILWGGFRYLW